MTEEVCRWGAEADPEEDDKTRVTKTSEVQKESQASAPKERVYRGERRNTTPSHPGNGHSKAGRQTESKAERQQGRHRETEREAERQQGREINREQSRETARQRRETRRRFVLFLELFLIRWCRRGQTGANRTEAT